MSITDFPAGAIVWLTRGQDCDHHLFFVRSADRSTGRLRSQWGECCLPHFRPTPIPATARLATPGEIVDLQRDLWHRLGVQVESGQSSLRDQKRSGKGWNGDHMRTYLREIRELSRQAQRAANAYELACNVWSHT